MEIREKDGSELSAPQRDAICSQLNCNSINIQLTKIMLIIF